MLRQVGCRVLYHGDFDYAGITIANLLIQRFGVETWRMSAADYASVRVDGPALIGKPVSACWDEHLFEKMHARGRAVLEESILDVLMGDLSVVRVAPK